MGAVHSQVPKIGEKVVKLEVQDRYVIVTFESGIKSYVYCGSHGAAVKIVNRALGV